MLVFMTASIEDQNDKSFLEEVYLNHKRLMFYTAGNYTANPEEKEDIVQDACVRLVRYAARLRKSNCCTLASFVVIITRCAAIDYLKKQKRMTNHIVAGADEQEIENIPDPGISPEKAVLIAERKQQVSAIWPKLSPREQILLEGRYWLGMSDQELAKILDVKSGSIRTYLSRARRHAMEELIKEGYDDDIS